MVALAESSFASEGTENWLTVLSTLAYCRSSVRMSSTLRVCEFNRKKRRSRCGLLQTKENKPEGCHI